MARPRTVYFAMIEGQEIGPMTRAEFALRLASQMVDEETFVWKQGMREWLPASQVQELASMFHLREEARRQGVRPPPPPAVAKAKSRAKHDDEEIELELDLDSHAAGIAEEPAAAAKGPPPPPKAPLQAYSLATMKSRPKAPQAKPPPPAEEAAPEEEPPSEEPAPAPPPGEDMGRTVIEMLPLGERVHQEQVGERLFDPGELPPLSTGKTGAFAIDSLKWAYQRKEKKEKDDAKKAALSQFKQVSTSVAPPPHPAGSAALVQHAPSNRPAAAAHARKPSRRVDRRTLAIVVLVIAGGLAFSVLTFVIFHLLIS